MPDMTKTREGSLAREPSNYLNGQGCREDSPKRPSDHQLPEARKKTLTEPYLLRQRQSLFQHTWRGQSPHNPSSYATFMLNLHWAKAATGKNTYASKVASVVSNSLQPYELWPPRLLCQGGFSRQEYWSVQAKTGCRILLEHYFSCCLAANPRVLPEPLRPKHLHHLHTWSSLGHTQVLQGSLRNKPQWTNHMQRWK